MFSHTIECKRINKPIIRYKTQNSIVLPQAIN